ncbi:MAG: prohibitin family protein [Fibrobacter sp.]|nr:prohibitin family protein [Fibrobacter sp.]
MKKTIFAIIIALAFVGCAQIDQTERGIILEFGKVDEVVEPGLTIYNFITKQVLKISVKTELQETRIESGSKDLQTVNVTVAVNYRIDPSKVDQVYTQYGMNGVEIALQPKIKETITGVTPQYTAEEMLQKREEIRQRMETTLKSKLDSANTHVIVEGLAITDFAFGKAFKEAVEAKQVAEQDALKEKNIKMKVEYQNEQKVAKAKADSAVIALQMQALKQQNGKEYLMLKYIEKWDGKLPQVSNGNALVLPKIE